MTGMTFPEALSSAMASRRLNDRDLAAKVRVSKQAVWSWRKGKHTPNRAQQAALANLMPELIGVIGEISKVPW